jgi:hypothetical protein
MKERPILFSGPMVRAILDGRKTQTRRVVKFRPRKDGAKLVPEILARAGVGAACPYGQSGDRLWVKETTWFDQREPDECVIYAATPQWHKYRLRDKVEAWEAAITTDYLERHEFWHRRPSIFMRRWASRITLEITGVRVERLKDISEEDAIAEGTTITDSIVSDDAVHASRAWVESYRRLWEQINGAGSWDTNPWVWAIGFRRLES